MNIFVLNINHLGQTGLINKYTRLATHFDFNKEIAHFVECILVEWRENTSVFYMSHHARRPSL